MPKKYKFGKQRGDNILQTYIIILTSITYVYKAQNILSNHGIKSNILKLRAGIDRRGCGYGLEVKESALYDATSLIERNRIKIVEVQASY